MNAESYDYRFDTFNSIVHFVVQAVLILVGLTLIVGILVYPDQYDFFNNFLSDLGRNFTVPNHNPDTISRVLYSFALWGGGFFLLVFFFLSRKAFDKLNTDHSLFWKIELYIGAIFGMISSVLLLSFPMVPLDLNAFVHHLIDYAFIGSIAVAGIFYSLYFLKFAEQNVKNMVFDVVFIGVLFVLMYYIKDIWSISGVLNMLGILFYALVLFILFAISVAVMFRYKDLRQSKRLDQNIHILSELFSLFFLPTVGVTLLLIVLNQEVRAIYEVILIWGFLIWVGLLNLRALLLSYKD